MGKDRAKNDQPRTLEGILRNFNFSPKGDYEGAILDTDGGAIQINWDREQMPPGLAPGRALVAIVEPEREGKHPEGEHPVFRLIAVESDGDKRGAGPGGVSGTVARLNYARHGEPNGVVLDTGDFIHLKPHGMKRTALAVGQHVVAEGPSRPSAAGGRVVEARIVNGIAI